eukprot:gene5685-33035_t
MTASSCPESFEECATTTTATTPSPACGTGAFYQNTTDGGTEGEAAGERDDPADGSVAAAAASCKPCPANTYMDEASHQYKVCKDALSNPCPPGTRFVSTVVAARTCVACNPGTFQSAPNHTSPTCSEHTPKDNVDCGDGERKVPGTATADISCSKASQATLASSTEDSDGGSKDDSAGGDGGSTESEASDEEDDINVVVNGKGDGGGSGEGGDGCGWNIHTSTCVVGGTTSQSEIDARLGDCSSSSGAGGTPRSHRSITIFLLVAFIGCAVAALSYFGYKKWRVRQTNRLYAGGGRGSRTGSVSLGSTTSRGSVRVARAGSVAGRVRAQEKYTKRGASTTTDGAGVAETEMRTNDLQKQALAWENADTAAVDGAKRSGETATGNAAAAAARVAAVPSDDPFVSFDGPGALADEDAAALEEMYEDVDEKEIIRPTSNATLNPLKPGRAAEDNLPGNNSHFAAAAAAAAAAAFVVEDGATPPRPPPKSQAAAAAPAADSNAVPQAKVAEKLWSENPTADGLMSARSVSTILKKSGLAEPVLKQVWTQSKGPVTETPLDKMSKVEFVRACILVISIGGVLVPKSIRSSSSSSSNANSMLTPAKHTPAPSPKPQSPKLAPATAPKPKAAPPRVAAKPSPLPPPPAVKQATAIKAETDNEAFDAYGSLGHVGGLTAIPQKVGDASAEIDSFYLETTVTDDASSSPVPVYINLKPDTGIAYNAGDGGLRPFEASTNSLDATDAGAGDPDAVVMVDNSDLYFGVVVEQAESGTDGSDDDDDSSGGASGALGDVGVINAPPAAVSRPPGRLEHINSSAGSQITAESTRAGGAGDSSSTAKKADVVSKGDSLHMALWKSSAQEDGYLPAKAVSAILKQSGLEGKQLKKVWNSAKKPTPPLDKMNQAEFLSACDLVVSAGGQFKLTPEQKQAVPAASFAAAATVAPVRLSGSHTAPPASSDAAAAVPVAAVAEPHLAEPDVDAHAEGNRTVVLDRMVGKKLGMRLGSAKPGRGVPVMSVDPTGQAAGLLEEGDRILSINGNSVLGNTIQQAAVHVRSSLKLEMHVKSFMLKNSA